MLSNTTQLIIIIRINGIAYIITPATCFGSLYFSHLQAEVLFTYEGKGKAVPLQECGGPEDSRKLRFPDYMTTAQDGAKVVSLTHRPPLPPGNTPGTHFC